MLVHDTPIEEHEGILVKREDLCCPLPGPSFSKMRGVVAHIAGRPESVIGVLDTYHSKAGWAVSYACQQLGKQAVNFWPRYKADKPGGLCREQQEIASSMGAKMVSLRAGRSAILYHEASKLLRQTEGPGSYMMPNALKLDESVSENALEAALTTVEAATLVVSISSGTVASGVIKGLIQLDRYQNLEIVLHMGYTRSQEAVQAYISHHVGCRIRNLYYVDEGYSYSDEARGVDAPFPCNPFYDLKAWKWLRTAKSSLKHPILFWNIGA